MQELSGTGRIKSEVYGLDESYSLENEEEVSKRQKHSNLYPPLEEVSPELLVTEDATQRENGSFDFEEQQLAEAFAGLPDRKRQVLTMLFVLEMEPEEIAKKLGCTVQNVYNQRSLALARLRTTLKGGEESD